MECLLANTPLIWLDLCTQLVVQVVVCVGGVPVQVIQLVVMCIYA